MFRLNLEADATEFHTGIVDRPPKDFLAAGTDVGHMDTEHFQTIFQLLFSLALIALL